MKDKTDESKQAGQCCSMRENRRGAAAAVTCQGFFARPKSGGEFPASA
jgi:hypothetical protein